MTEPHSPPPPWILKGQLWTFPITRPLLGKGKLDLPAGTYPEGAELHLSDKEEFVGGLGMLMLLRYRETPVGPYDELVHIPGDFSSPSFPSSPKSLRSLRITAIYVSTQASVDAGRFHWNIPKHLAHFVFDPLPGGRTLITISHSPTSPQPFFRATLTPSTYFTPFNIPLRTVFASGTSLNGYSPLNDFVQPPLVPAPPGRKEGEWMRFRGKIVGGMKGCWIEGGMGAERQEEGKKQKRRDLGDGRATTRGEEVWKFGAYCEEVTLVFGGSETMVIE